MYVHFIIRYLLLLPNRYLLVFPWYIFKLIQIEFHDGEFIFMNA